MKSKTKIKISPSVLLLLFTLAAARDLTLPAVFLAAFIHELGHLLAAYALNIKIRLFELDIFGAKLYPARALPSYITEGALAVAGPAASFLLWVLLLPFSTPFAVLLRNTSLALGLFNLFPVSGFDGGRILSSLLSPRLGPALSARVLAITSYLSLLLLFALASCMLLRYGQNLTLAILAAALFAKTFLLDAL